MGNFLAGRTASFSGLRFRVIGFRVSAHFPLVDPKPAKKAVSMTHDKPSA